MGLQSFIYIVTNWDRIKESNSSEVKNILNKTGDFFLFNMGEKPDWCFEYKTPLFLENWKFARWALEYYENHIRIKLSGYELKNADTLMIDIFGDLNSNAHQDLHKDLCFKGFNEGLLLSLSPENVDHFKTRLSAYINMIREFDINKPEDGYEYFEFGYFPEFSDYMNYLKHWENLLKTALDNNAGIIIEAC